jgi:uncharacterized membrane protein
MSQVALHMSVAFGVMYAMTGSVAFGGVAALVEPICNVALLPLHDRVWEKIRERAQRSGRAFRREALATVGS